MFTRCCLLGLLSVPATWLLAAWLAWTLSGPVAPEKPPRVAAVNSDESADAPAVVQPGTASAARPEVKIVIGADFSAAGPVTLHTLALQQCTRYILDLVLARDGSADGRRPASCSRMLTAWTREAVDHLAAVLGPFGAWTRYHARSAREESCRGWTMG